VIQGLQEVSVLLKGKQNVSYRQNITAVHTYSLLCFDGNFKHLILLLVFKHNRMSSIKIVSVLCFGHHIFVWNIPIHIIVEIYSDSVFLSKRNWITLNYEYLKNKYFHSQVQSVYWKWQEFYANDPFIRSHQLSELSTYTIIIKSSVTLYISKRWKSNTSVIKSTMP